MFVTCHRSALCVRKGFNGVHYVFQQPHSLYPQFGGQQQYPPAQQPLPSPGYGQPRQPYTNGPPYMQHGGGRPPYMQHGPYPQQPQGYNCPPGFPQQVGGPQAPNHMGPFQQQPQQQPNNNFNNVNVSILWTLISTPTPWCISLSFLSLPQGSSYKASLLLWL